jgi:spore coat polysaccharide biosynthesis protein SpsF (cytidylyltransferase family)/MoaA/NifB/PqqE/SkfB family radical SAM enzyme
MNNQKPTKIITAIIQSSWKSELLENKSLFELSNGKTVLEMIVDSVKKIDHITRIVLATSDNPNEEALIAEARRLGIAQFVGPADAVLERMSLVARENPGVLLKIDGNKPLFDPIEAEKLLHDHIDGGYEYSINGHYDGVVYGTDCEIINTSIFDKVNWKRLLDGQNEAGTIHLRYLTDVKVFAKPSASPRHHYRCIFETTQDLEVINFIVSNSDIICNDAVIKVLGDNPVYAQHNAIETKREVGLNKIMLFPEKIKTINSVTPDSPDSTYPISVELSLTMRCNFDCVWCSDKDLRAKQEDDLLLERISKLAKDLAAGGTRGVVIEGGGEPTIVRHFNQAVEIFKEEGLSLGLITNGSTKLKSDVLRKFDWVRVSLDASTAAEMRDLKKYKNFDKIISNIIHYARYCNTVGIGYVATNQNTSELESLILRFRDSGISYIQIRPVIDHPELVPEYDFDYLKKYQTPTFSVITDGMRENRIRGNGGVGCRSHSLSTVITADGSVYLCGRLNIYDWVKPAGNINFQSFKEIWDGPERSRQSAEMLDPGFCTKYCPECRITKFNIEFDKLNNIKTSNFI